MDFIGPLARTQFQNHLAVRRKERNQLVEVDIAGEGRLVILGRPNTVLHMASKRARRDRPQPFLVVNEAKIFFDLNMPEIVPIAEHRRIQLVEQSWYLAFGRNFFVAAPSFDAN